MNDLSGVGIFHFKIHLISAFCKRAYIEFNLKLRLIAAGDRAVVDLGFIRLDSPVSWFVRIRAVSNCRYAGAKPTFSIVRYREALSLIKAWKSRLDDL